MNRDTIKYQSDPAYAERRRAMRRESYQGQKTNPEYWLKLAANLARQRETGDRKIKESVRRKTNRAIKAGVLVRSPCESCGDTNSQAHHDDYAKPLEVRWLCQTHHALHHRLERAALKALEP